MINLIECIFNVSQSNIQRRTIVNNNLNDGIYNAKELGVAKVIVLGLQHMFAMFGATVLVPLLTGLDVSTTSP